MILLPGRQYARGQEGLFLFIALRWMQRPERVMVGLAENIQACLRIFRRAQHQWLVRDILHLPQGVFTVFVLWHTGQLLHIALRCLEGSTMSNLVHRRRRCARIDPYMILCLEGSTPEDRCLSLFIALR